MYRERTLREIKRWGSALGENRRRGGKTKATTKTILVHSEKEYLCVCVCVCVCVSVCMSRGEKKECGCVHLETAGMGY